jgi:biopolymer transport protein ExbB
MERRRLLFAGLFTSAVLVLKPRVSLAAAADQILTEEGVNVSALLQAGGSIGYVIMALSVAMVALIVEHLFSIRRGSLMPPGLAEQVQQLIAAGQIQQAEQACRQRPSFLGYVLGAGLQEVAAGYGAVEKAMEDAAGAQAARLMRRIEYLSAIGTIAPMLGLLGTVWGMILAFSEFADRANPQVAEFAPAISVALVTTLQGLCVAIPALATLAILRNRVDEFVMEASLTAEHVVSPLKRMLRARRRSPKAARRAGAKGGPERTAPPSVTREREPPR